MRSITITKNGKKIEMVVENGKWVEKTDLKPILDTLVENDITIKEDTKQSNKEIKNKFEPIIDEVVSEK